MHGCGSAVRVAARAEWLHSSDPGIAANKLNAHKHAAAKVALAKALERKASGRSGKAKK